MRYYLDLRGKTDFLIDKKYIDKLAGIVVDEHFNLSKLKIDNIRVVNAKLHKDDELIGEILDIKTPEQMQNMLEMEINPNYSVYLLETGDWHIIPIENLIAKFSKIETKFMRY